jgi:hypothetical protein
MATIRNRAILGAGILAGLMLIIVAGGSPSRAQSAAATTAGAPLQLTPAVRQTRTAHRRAKHSRQAAQRPTQRSRTAKHSPEGAPAPRREEGFVIEVPSGVKLTSLLPWWRADEMQAIRYRDREAESQVLSAADAWFAALGIDKIAPAGNEPALAAADDLNRIDETAVIEAGLTIADADEVNAIDLAAEQTPPPAQPENKSWLNILLASLGGALAVASTARYLFV